MSDIITENRLRKIDFFQKIENIRPDIRLVLFIFRRIRLLYRYCGFFFVVVATFDGKGKKVYNESVKKHKKCKAKCLARRKKVFDVRLCKAAVNDSAGNIRSLIFKNL